MSIYTDEIFGPVLHVRALTTKKHWLPSEHEYGNGAAVFTATATPLGDFVSWSRSAWWASTCRSRFRCPTTASAAGSGPDRRLNQYGTASIQFYTKVKTVTERWPSGIKDGAEFVIPTMKRAETGHVRDG